jgi:DNA end-binding protein Ku
MALHTMFYEDELHKANQPSLPKEDKFSQKEVELAKRLVDTLPSLFKLDEYHDTYPDNVLKMIEQRQKGNKVTPIRQPRVAPVMDVIAALQQRLSKAGSGVGKTKKSAAKTAAKKTAAKRKKSAA